MRKTDGIINFATPYNTYACRLQFSQYPNGRIAMTLIGAETSKYSGEVIAVCTANVPEFELAVDEVAIKDYSENVGMLECLKSHGIIEETGKTVTPFIVALPICKLLLKPPFDEEEPMIRKLISGPKKEKPKTKVEPEQE